MILSETSFADSTNSNPPVPLGIIFPDGKSITQDNQKYKAFTIPEEYSVLLSIYAGYTEYSRNYKLNFDTQLKLEQINDLLQIQIQNRDDLIVILKDTNEDLNDIIKEEVKQKDKNIFWKHMFLGIAIAAVAAAIGEGIYIVAHD